MMAPRSKARPTVRAAAKDAKGSKSSKANKASKAAKPARASKTAKASDSKAGNSKAGNSKAGNSKASNSKAGNSKAGAGKRARATGDARTASGLSHERIRREALRLIDEDGLDELSTRKLGRALGCEAMALYWYYPSKERLLDAVVDELMSRIDVPAGDGDGSWVDAMRRVAYGYRGLSRRHPKAFPLLATRRFASEGSFEFLETLFALARQQGLSDRTTARFFRVISSYCSGIALNELAPERSPDLDPSSFATRFARVASANAWLTPEHHDDVFAFGLEILLDALAGSAGSAEAPEQTGRLGD
jgi:AcrR family transcriptional regulator